MKLIRIFLLILSLSNYGFALSPIGVPGVIRDLRESLNNDIELSELENKAIAVSGYYVYYGSSEYYEPFKWIYINRSLSLVAKLQGIRDNGALLWKYLHRDIEVSYNRENKTITFRKVSEFNNFVEDQEAASVLADLGLLDTQSVTFPIAGYFAYYGSSEHYEPFKWVYANTTGTLVKKLSGGDPVHHGLRYVDLKSKFDSITVTDRHVIFGQMIRPTANESHVDVGVEVSEMRGDPYSSFARVKILLRSAPSANVIVPFSSRPENALTILPTQLVFTPQNWNIPQTVRVKVVNQEIQNPTLIVKALESEDYRYRGIDPEDIVISSPSLEVDAPQNILLTPGEEATFQLKVNYTGAKELSFYLVNAPEGMRIEAHTGVIVWRPTEEQQGRSYPIHLRVTDGNIVRNIEFTVKVARLVPVETSRERGYVEVTQRESNLRGLRVGRVAQEEYNITSDRCGYTRSSMVRELLPLDIEIYTIQSPSVSRSLTQQVVLENTPIPDYIEKLTDYFVIDADEEGYFAISYPYRDEPNIKVFALVEGEDIDGKIWASIGVKTKIVGGRIRFYLPKIKGIYFIGRYQNNAIFSRSVLPENLQNNKARCCLLHDTEENTYKCFLVNTHSTIRISGVPSSGRMWGGMTVLDVASSFEDAQRAIDALSMKYSKEFSVQIEPLGRGNLGFVSSMEHRSKLHITNNFQIFPSVIKGTLVHEYFHNAQGMNSLDHLSPFINTPYIFSNWIIEGTARWFEDYVYDNLDTYIWKERYGARILEKGLNAKSSQQGDIEARPYQRFAFFKMLKNKCNSFDMNSLLSYYDLRGYTNIQNVINNGSCNFDDISWPSNISALEKSLLYYQYATAIKNNIRLLDPNENNHFQFSLIGYKLTRSDFNPPISTEDTQSENQIYRASINFPSSILPSLGVYSVEVPLKDIFSPQELDYKDVWIHVQLRQGDPDILVAVWDKERETYTQFFHTAEGLQFKITSDSFVLNFVNPNREDVGLNNIAIELRSHSRENSGSIDIIQPQDGVHIDRRVIDIQGAVKENENVDAVVIQNGNDKLMVPLDANKEFKAKVTIAIGENRIKIVGVNSAHPSFPLTEEKVLKVYGERASTIGVNALLPSKIVIVLRWDTRKDIDLHVIDKFGREIFYGNANVPPGYLDVDNTMAYGPEVVTYKDVDDEVYRNGTFQVNIVDFSYGNGYGNSTPSYYYIDVVLNETNPDHKKIYHYKTSRKMLGLENALKIYCDQNQICHLEEKSPELHILE